MKVLARCEQCFGGRVFVSLGYVRHDHYSPADCHWCLGSGIRVREYVPRTPLFDIPRPCTWCRRLTDHAPMGTHNLAACRICWPKRSHEVIRFTAEELTPPFVDSEKPKHPRPAVKGRKRGRVS